jgi:hypothetical protein
VKSSSELKLDAKSRNPGPAGAAVPAYDYQYLNLPSICFQTSGARSCARHGVVSISRRRPERLAHALPQAATGGWMSAPGQLLVAADATGAVSAVARNNARQYEKPRNTFCVASKWMTSPLAPDLAFGSPFGLPSGL